jgi:hypothetical protein
MNFIATRSNIRAARIYPPVIQTSSLRRKNFRGKEAMWGRRLRILVAGSATNVSFALIREPRADLEKKLAEACWSSQAEAADHERIARQADWRVQAAECRLLAILDRLAALHQHRSRFQRSWNVNGRRA